MRGDLTIKILEIILNGVGSTAEILLAFLDAGYGASTTKLDYHLQKISTKREKFVREIADSLKETQRFYNMLGNLKREGIVKKINNGWALTGNGLRKLEKLKNKLGGQLAVESYPLIFDNELKIFIFDIPEKEKNKRVWLRRQLTELKFKMLQKSVWSGKVKIPDRFIKKLREFKIINFIEILVVTKTGTLKEYLR